MTGNETLEEIFIKNNARIIPLMTVIIIKFTKYFSVRLRRTHANAGIVEICFESLSI